MQKLTLKKIARELDVSISTVSKALKDNPEISEETRRKIQAFAKLYNYKPNNIALSLKNRKTKTLGVIIPEIVHHFFTTVISGIESVANNHGYNVIIGMSNESFTKEVLNMEMLANGSIDGFILSVSKETQLLKDYHHLQETINQGMPIVMFDRSVEGVDCDRVIVNDVEGSKKAVARLVELGCKNIGIITTEDHVNVGKLRRTGYEEALTESHFNVNNSFILKLNDEVNDEGHIDLLEKEIYNFLKKNPTLDAIFAVNEIYALTAMSMANKLGKNIPKDLKVIGFTDGILSKYANPSLSTVSQHGKKIGEVAAELLIKRLENEDQDIPFQTIIIETALVERNSTGQN